MQNNPHIQDCTFLPPPPPPPPPPPHLHAPPAPRVRRRPRPPAHKHVPQRILAVPPRKRHPLRHRVVDKLGPLEILGRHPALHPLHHRPEHVALPRKRHPRGRCV